MTGYRAPSIISAAALPRAEAGTLARTRYYARSLATLARGVRRPVPVALSLALRRRPADVVLRDGLRFRCRDAMDLWVVKETCLDRDYEPASHRVRPGDRVIDVGAGLGDFAVRAAVLGGAARVIAVEPDADSHALLVRHARDNGADAVVALHGAVAAKAGTVELAPAKHRLAAATRAAMGGRAAVRAHALGDLVDDLPGGACDFLKVDIEGGEYELFASLDARVLASIARISLEVHPAPAGRRQALLATLEAAGFALRHRASPVHRGLGLVYASRRVAAWD